MCSQRQCVARFCMFFRTHIIVFVKLFVRLDLEKKRKKAREEMKKVRTDMKEEDEHKLQRKTFKILAKLMKMWKH